MANSFTSQTLLDGSRNAILKLTGVLDTSDLALQAAISMSSLTQGGSAAAPTSVRIDKIEYSISDQLEVQLLWEATANVLILPLAGREDMCFREAGGLQNNAGAGKTGNILIRTTGWTSGTQVFTLIITMVKNP